jgi:hypothetical protein
MSEFKTIAAHIDDLRTEIRQTSDDSIWSDKYLYKKLVDARSILIKRELDKHKFISDFNYITMCVNLEPGVPIDCGCSDLQCKVLVSTQELPNPLQNKYTLMMKVLDGSFTEVPYGDQTTTKLFKYYKTLKDKKSYTIINNKLIVYNADLRIKTIIVKLIPVDPVELATFNYTNTCGCDVENPEVQPCFDITTSNFPIDSWLNSAMYTLVKTQLLTPALKEDLLNDAQSIIK